MRAKHGIPLATRIERSRHRAVVAEDHPVFLVRVDKRALSIFKNVFLVDLDAFAKQQPLHWVEVALDAFCGLVPNAHSTPLHPRRYRARC